MNGLIARYIMVALSVMGSAILLFSCESHEAADAAASEETMMTEYSENLSIVESKNGRRSYHFVTPLVEGYSLAREPYREFRKGVKITTYKDDSLSTVDAVLTANYAIYYENRKLWEAKGNVVVVKSDGKNLYTQQLFWNQLTKKIYSNVDSKIVQNDGRDVFIGEGFESDEEFKDWRFRRMKGRMEVEVKPTEQEVEIAPDSTADTRRGAPVPAVAPVPAASGGSGNSTGGATEKPAVRPAVAPDQPRRTTPARGDASGRPARTGEPSEARSGSEPGRLQQQMQPAALKLEEHEMQTTQ